LEKRKAREKVENVRGKEGKGLKSNKRILRNDARNGMTKKNRNRI